MADNTHSSRIAAFKNTGKGSQELRRKRLELSVALRKQARDEQLLKRRAVSPTGDNEESKTETDKLLSPSEIVQGLNSKDLAVRVSSARAARRILSREQNPPISLIVEAGCIKPLVEALQQDNCTDLQFEAAWALTNIASGNHDQTMAVLEGGAVPYLVDLLSRGGVVAEQSIWALGNIAGDGSYTRDIVLRHDILPALLPYLEGTTTLSLTRTAVWTFSNLCRNKNPMVQFDLVSPALPYVSELLTTDDKDILADTCWALSYMTDGPDDRIEMVQATPNLLERMIKLLDHNEAAVRTPALRTVGNMVTGSDEQTTRCLNMGCLDYLVKLLRCGKSSLVKEASWAVSNILAGTEEQIQRAVDAGVLMHIVHVIANEEPRCQKEAAWAITNLCLGGTGPQLAALLNSGFLQPYCNLLKAADQRTIIVVLDGITNLLKAAEKFGEVEQLCYRLEEIEALDAIEALQTHENESVYKKALCILDTYFAEPDENEQPAQGNDDFTFGVTNQNIDF